ncbi:MAG: molybdopterin-dependent oxidoreductase, partial [Candidatus Latescibacterota bacterium]
MSSSSKKITVSIDGQAVETQTGLTVLDTAARHDVYIPTLCAHKDLSPFGACRMCVVEIKGMRGYPAACTTPVVDGMEITTNSPAIRNARLDVLKLILSEHPSSCLICDERLECVDRLSTIRKAGVTTGCRYCPSDGQCELQTVVEHLGVDELDFPVIYRGIEVKKGDPFIERDYNLCILCGRCVRVCSRVRGANTLTFANRGPDTVIATAFDRLDVEAGCEFCGECVEMCPTGALAEKARKWEGVADREVTTTCPLCGVGCQLRLQIKGSKVIGSLPADDPLVNNGQLCVKGRFCLPELVDNHRRLVKPVTAGKEGRLDISIDEAVDIAAEKLTACGRDDVAMLVSANLTNEDLYIAQKFVRVALGSNAIESDAQRFYGDRFGPYVGLLEMSGTIGDLRRAGVILCIGVNTQYAYSIVNVELRRAAARGARIVTINPREHNLTILADTWIKPVAGREPKFYDTLLSAADAKELTSSPHRRSRLFEDADELAGLLTKADDPVIVVGSEVLRPDTTWAILQALRSLTENIGARVVVLPPQNNLYGAIVMGAAAGLLPGAVPISDIEAARKIADVWGGDLERIATGVSGTAGSSRRKKRVVYSIGDVPPGGRPKTDFLIYQNIYPAGPELAPDLILPAAAFSETDGTFTSGEGRIQKVNKAVDAPGSALPDWEILCRIARAMGVSGFDFDSAADIRREIARMVSVFDGYDFDARAASPLPPGHSIESFPAKGSRRRKDYPFLLYVSNAEHTYRGFSLNEWVDGCGD